MRGLTERQAEILAFLRSRIEKDQIAPSIHEIREHFGFASPNAVADHLRLLEKKGCIRRPLGLKRAIYLTRPDAEGLPQLRPALAA